MVFTKNSCKAVSIALVLLVMLLGQVAAASEDWGKWQIYENDHFVIYSDAKEKKVLELLQELEKFHVLVQIALTTKIPKEVQKTNVLLFKRRSDFKKYTWNSNIGGFMSYLDSIPLIVMPASSGGLNSETTIKHEYVHVAQSYDKKALPKWLKEGMAELLSTATYRDNYGVVGHANKDRWRYLSREVSYDKLIADEYDGIKRRFGADAYAQYWLLTVYSLAHKDGMYRDELGKYIQLYRNGEDSLASFKQAYGVSPNAFAREAMRNFGRRSYSYRPLVWKLDFSQLDLSPTKSVADTQALNRFTEVLKNRVIKHKADRKKKK